MLEEDGMVSPNRSTSRNHTRGPKRGLYEHFTPAKKATVGRKAAEIGVVTTVKSFSKQFHVHE